MLRIKLLTILFLCILLSSPVDASDTAIPDFTLSPADQTFLELIERQTFNYFLFCTNPENGLVMDRASNHNPADFNYAPATIAGVGFGLSSLVVGVERGWIEKEKAELLTLKTLQTFLTELECQQGFFYHFIDMKTGKRVWNCELSSIDTALFLAGVILAMEYYDNPLLQQTADDLYRRVNWQWMLNGGEHLSMGWTPEKGFIEHRWNDYAESMLMYIMALGSPTFPVSDTCWRTMNRPLGQYGPYRCILSPPLFTHQYSQVWIDFRSIRDDSANYFYNSRQATLANRQFCIDSHPSFSTYGPDCWGLTAAIGPDGYRAYGAAPGQAVSDGTVAPTAAGSSIVFTPRESLAVLKNLYQNHGQKLWGNYGFADSFNLDRNFVADDAYAINQGPMLLMIENLRSGLLWKTFMKNRYIQRGLTRAGFRPDPDLSFSPTLKEQTTKVFLPHQRPVITSQPLLHDRTLANLDFTDTAWDSAPVINLRETDSQTGFNRQPGYQVDTRLLHNDQVLFLRIQVTDNELSATHSEALMYQDDGLEIYLDTDNDQLIWGGDRDYQILLSPTADLDTLRVSERFHPGSNDAGINHRYQRTAQGFECILALDRKIFLLNGTRETRSFGFTIAAHNLDPAQGSDCKMNWFFAEPGILLGQVKLPPLSPDPLLTETTSVASSPQPQTVASGTEKTELMVWAMGAEGKLIRQMADRFEAANPDIRIITQAIPWNGAHEKLMTAVVGNIPPDVCQLGTTWMSEFVAMNALEPLDSYMKNSTNPRAADFFSGCLDSIVSHGEVFGIPWYVDTRLLYYRTDMVKAAGFDTFPGTWDEFLALARKLQSIRSETGQEGYSLSLPVNDWQIFLIYLWQSGGEVLNADLTHSLIASEASGDAIRYLQQFFAEKLSPLEAARDLDIFNAFESGFFPMFISGPWMISEIERSKPELTGRWMTAPMPTGKTNTSFIGGANLVIFRNSPHKEAAWKFVQFMSRPDIQVDWYGLSKNLPAHMKSWESPLLQANPYLTAFQEQLRHTRAPPALPEWELIASILSQAFEQIVYHRLTVEEGLAQCQEKIDRVLVRTTTQQTPLFKVSLTILLCVLIIGAVLFYLIRRKKDSGMISRGKYYYIGYLFLAPALGVLLLFLFIPIVATFILSLTNWNIYAVNDISRVTFIGIENYRNLLVDPVFWISLKNTMLFSLIGVPLNIALALFTAVLLNQQVIRCKAFFRVGFFIPVITTMVAVAVVWRWLYNPEFGVFNYLLSLIGMTPQNWLSDTTLVLPSLILMAVWKGFGYNMIIFIAALQSIPEYLYEAAEIDGASSFQKFIHITVPMLKKTTVFIVIMTTIGYLQFFAEPYIMTQGGPLNSSISVVLYMYNHGFKFYNLGYASAIAYVLFGIIFVFTLIQFRLSAAMEPGGGK